MSGVARKPPAHKKKKTEYAGKDQKTDTSMDGEDGGCEDQDVVMSVFLTGLPYFVPGLPPRLFVPP